MEGRQVFNARCLRNLETGLTNFFFSFFGRHCVKLKNKHFKTYFGKPCVHFENTCLILWFDILGHPVCVVKINISTCGIYIKQSSSDGRTRERTLWEKCKNWMFNDYGIFLNLNIVDYREARITKYFLLHQWLKGYHQWPLPRGDVKLRKQSLVSKKKSSVSQICLLQQKLSLNIFMYFFLFIWNIYTN